MHSLYMPGTYNILAASVSAGSMVGDCMGEKLLTAKVTALTDKLLLATRKLEDMLLELRGISCTLSDVTHKLTSHQSFQLEDWDVLKTSEDWLSANRLLDLVLQHEGDIKAGHPSLSSLEFTNNKLALYGYTDSHHSIRDLSSSRSIDLVKGLDEVHDLDWDCEGIQLPSPSSNTVIPFSPVETGSDLSPLDTAGNTEIVSSLLSNNKYSSVSSLTSCSTYLGLYEEAMEMTLELEEGFYSEDEDFSDINQGKRLKHSSGSTDVSIHSIDDKVLQLSPSPCEYKFVSIDDDLQSVSSDFCSYPLSQSIVND